jgi:hypothetical protein
MGKKTFLIFEKKKKNVTKEIKKKKFTKKLIFLLIINRSGFNSKMLFWLV